MSTHEDDLFFEEISHSEVPLIFKSYKFYCLLQPIIQKFPKPFRYSLGEKIQTTLLNIIQDTTQGLYSRQPLREPYILNVLAHIQTLRIFIRLCLVEKLIDETRFFNLSEAITELMKMGVGWLKTTRSK